METLRPGPSRQPAGAPRGGGGNGSNSDSGSLGRGSSSQRPPSMEVAHVLFMDIIGYSRLRMNQQAAAQLELQNLVNTCLEVRQAKMERKFICRPTGDGMALLFFRDMVSPVRAALQLHALMAKNAGIMRNAIGADIKLRMGIHSGTVLMVEDLNSQSDAAGDGINIAQRVMDCGDADHILVSSKVAESLINADPWQHYLKDIGQCRVKHGVLVHLYLLHGRLDGEYYGNPAIPLKVKQDQDERQELEKKYRGTIFDQHPGLKGKLVGTGVVAVLVGIPAFLWATNPAFKKTIQTTYAKLTDPSVSQDNPKGKKTAAKQPKGHSSSGGDETSRTAATVARVDDGSGETQKVLAPDLTGHTFEDAVATARDENLKVFKSNKGTYNTQFGEGIVYQQSPAAGTAVSVRTPIYVRISKGDPPENGAGASTEKTDNTEGGDPSDNGVQ